MTGLAIYDAPLAEQITYAKALASSGMLPAQYRGKPDNLLWAISYAQMLGCHPLTAVTGVHVIEGKPSASAALISALVRRAGHKLRVSGDGGSATAQIIRHDDPEYVFEVTFTLEDAKTAGLLNKDVWKKYPASMLKARAITQCARDACEEALSGLHHTAEELGADVDGEDGSPVIDGEVVPQASSLATDSAWPESVAKVPATDVAWRADWRARLAIADHPNTYDELWREMKGMQHAGDLTPDDAEQLAKEWTEGKQGYLKLLEDAETEPVGHLMPEEAAASAAEPLPLEVDA